MDILNNEVPVSAPVIQSFGPGGQAYIYDMETGFMVTSERTNPIFDFAATDKSVANAEFLTNLTEARKIGSTMAVKAVQIGFRVSKIDGSVCSPAETAAMKALLASSRVKLTYGSNDTVVGEFAGQHIMGAIDNMCADATATAMSQAGNNNCTAWINLPVPIGMQPNVNIGGSVRFTLPVPAALLPANSGAPSLFAFKVILAGLKSVK
ncbi:MAG: hypothetical protein IIU66_04960 [Clostridia bacterium]|nr:hypothetical protein [Clostridia bacterium]